MDKYGKEQRGKHKTRLPIEVARPQPKPAWIKAKIPTSPLVAQQRSLFRQHGLKTVCEEAACPNLGECFSAGTATFMIMGDICTRRCPFCDVMHGYPTALDTKEPAHLAEVVELMGLRYVVITSVDRDDLKDGGATHFVRCIQAIRTRTPHVKVEILVPDFRHKIDRALSILQQAPPDVFNHNMETVPQLYKRIRPVADYPSSLSLIGQFKQQHPDIPTKSGLMLGLGEWPDQIKQVLKDLRRYGCDMLTLGQYLQPSRYHLPVARFIPPHEFQRLGEYARTLGFTHVASAPMVRSSYHADLQASGASLDGVN